MSYESSQKTPVPTPCPKCGSKVIAVMWDATLNFLKFRSWLHCTNDDCNYCETADEMKERLLTV